MPRTPGEAGGHEGGRLGLGERGRRPRRQVERLGQELVGAAARCGYDLPAASWTLLEYLDTYGGLRLSDIAACHGVDVSSITPRLKRLESAGLVERERVPTDARAFLITITADGARALESVHATRRELLRGALTGIDADSVADATDVLSRITRHLSREQFRPEGR